MRLVVTDFLTLDGVMEAPGMEAHPSGRNGWALQRTDDDLEAFNGGQILNADAIILGRTTYQIWAAFWPTATGADAIKNRLDAIPKYVVSNTLKRTDWVNSVILSGDVMERVRELKAQPGGDILCYGSADLVMDLMKHDLVDEYRFLLFPVVLGDGKHFFREGIDLRHLELRSVRSFDSGVVLLVYEPATEEPTSPYVGTFTWTQEQVRSLQAAQDTERILATVLFTDIVDSTGRAAAVGDRRWRQLLDRHDQVARTEIGRWHGTYVKSTGDGILATFDTPTRALRCAFGLGESLAETGLEIRAGIHTGEIELRGGGDIGGIGVHIASRALAEAAPGGVVVTRTVRDLATGTDLTFDPLGTVGLRGVPGQWELFAASIA
jgi:class 3 adenylate cyclase/dihydrofolate reductase